MFKQFLKSGLFFCALFFLTASSSDVFDETYFWSDSSKNTLKILWGDTDDEPCASGVSLYFGESKAEGQLTCRIVVRLSEGGDEGLFTAQDGYRTHQKIPLAGELYRVSFDSPKQALAAANTLYSHADTVFSHPDFLLPFSKRSVDPTAEPYYQNQWHLENTGQVGPLEDADMDVSAAWEVTTGNPSVIVAALDLGFQQEHPDMQGAWYVNSGEIAGNKIDDDENGLKDDVSGWNYATNSNKLIYGAAASHGTAVSGIIGARVNGDGVTGVCPECKVLPLVIDNSPSNAAAAFYYAKAAGASVITNSWGYEIGTPQTDVVEEAIRVVAEEGRSGKGISILFAMNNINRDDCRENFPDISSHPSVIAISSSNYMDRKVEKSGWGSCLKLLAPSGWTDGPRITTIDRTGGKGYNKASSSDDYRDLDYTNTFYGTSAAAPSAAGAFALVYSLNPDLNSSEVLAAMLGSADKVNPNEASYDPDTGHSLKYGFGRINVGRAVESLTK